MASKELKYNSEKLDSCLNTFRETFSKPEIDSFKGSVILPLDFSLEMDGIAGIIPHSAFEIPTNSLPSNYIVKTGADKGLSKIAFILHTIDHNFNNNKWTTKITGQTLNIRYDELTETQKSALINKTKTSPLTGEVQNKSGFSNITGGSIKNIKGIIYRNGEIPNDKLRTILNESKYNNPTINKSDGGRVRLFIDASLALDNLLSAATHSNINFKVNSAYRTYNDQARVFKDNCSNSIGTGRCQVKPGKNSAAQAGTSNHGFGLAVDLANTGGTKLTTSMPEYVWMKNNASKFGFKRLPFGNRGENWEAWHWEYQVN
jgi:LAS superfamily LD-carboxypeptidase LdcB